MCFADCACVQVSAVDNAGVLPYNQAFATVRLIVLNDFQRIAIIFNLSVDAIALKEAEIVK